jgi:hypothetical protein
VHKQSRVWSSAGRRIVLFGLTVLLPAAAWASPVGLYPLQGKGLSRQALAKVQQLVLSGARVVAEDEESFEVGDQPAVRAGCGDAESATPACLRRLAGDGVLLFGTAEREGDDVIVTLALIDGRGRVSRAVWFRENLAVAATGPAAQAIGELARASAEGQLMPTRDSRRTAQRP